jgi:hypothetical protein
MKSIKNIFLTGLLSIGILSTSTLTSCNRDECKEVVCANGGSCDPDDGSCICATGYEGNLCGDEVRDNYNGSYRGSGSDNTGATYTNFTFTYSNSGTNALAMQLSIANTAGTPFLTVPIRLITNTTYEIQSTTVGNFTYTGNGSISENNATIVLNQDGTPDLVITFNNLVAI